PYSADNPDIEHGRHAIAIDERRAFFRTNLWRHGGRSPAQPHGPKDEVQVWFPGVHCDVGGGYPEQDSGLSKLALEWMLDEAVPLGLLVDAGRVTAMLGTRGGTDVPPDPNGVLHESLTGLWTLAEFVPKRHFNWTTGK